jgi:PBSX family phage terminase large subunit
MLYEFNPAPKLSHWTYDWLRDLKDTEDVLAYKTCYDDIPEEEQRQLLGDIYLKRIHKLKEIDPEQYKSIYKGLPANLSGTVYKLFDTDRHIKEPTYNYDDITIGVDFGGADATVFSALGWVKGFRGLEMFSEYYHKNGESNQIKTINDYVDEFLRYAKSIHEWWGKAISVYIDPANLTFKQLVEQKSYEDEYSFIVIDNFIKLSSEKGKSSVQERIDLTEIMWGSNFLTVSPKCKNFIKATQEAEYNDRNERADDGRSNIDSLDAFEYSWLKEKKLIKDIILG